MGVFISYSTWFCVVLILPAADLKGGFGGGGRGFSGARASVGLRGGSFRSGGLGTSSRYSSSFGGGYTFFGFGGFHRSSSGYAYECSEPNSTVITRCREKNTTFTDSDIGSPDRITEFHEAIAKKPGYTSYDNGTVIVNSLQTPMTWCDRVYYWNRTFFDEEDAENKTICKLVIEKDDDETFQNILLMETMAKPTELVWGCPTDEYCCGYECCKPENEDAGAIVMVVAIMGLLSICCICCVKYCKKKKDEQISRARDLRIGNSPNVPLDRPTDTKMKVNQDSPSAQPSPRPKSDNPPPEYSPRKQPYVVPVDAPRD